LGKLPELEPISPKGKREMAGSPFTRIAGFGIISKIRR